MLIHIYDWIKLILMSIEYLITWSNINTICICGNEKYYHNLYIKINRITHHARVMQRNISLESHRNIPCQYLKRSHYFVMPTSKKKASFLVEVILCMLEVATQSQMLVSCHETWQRRDMAHLEILRGNAKVLYLFCRYVP